MRLRFDQEYLSIGPFDEVDLPSMAVLTGVNGSGKTHLLKAIAKGAIRIDGVSARDIKYYHYDHFRLAESNSGNSQRNLANTLWNQRLATNRGGANWQVAATNLFKKHFGHIANLDKLRTDQEWSKLFRKKANREAFRSYQDDIEKEIYNGDLFYGFDERDEIVAAFKRAVKPIHLFDQGDFTDRFVGVGGDRSLSISVSDLFTKYMIRQAKWVFERWSSGRLNLTREELDAEFQREFPAPWIVLNQLLDGIYAASEHRDAPLFQFSVPEAGAVTPQEWARYRFDAKLVDRRTGQERDYSALSSGEKILVSLVVATYSSRAGPLPRLLLLDEVDACLHPSLVRALLATCQSAFVAQGIDIILATHSPTTVALSPDQAIFVVKPGRRDDKVAPLCKADAMAVMTEGFATLQEGQVLFQQTLSEGIHVLTEGHNVKYLELYLQLKGISGVNFIKGLEASSGKDQLKQYATFLQAVPHDGDVLIVFDPDVASIPSDSNKVFSFKLQADPNNTYCKGGIEQAFPPTLFASYLNSVTTSTGNQYMDFDKTRKVHFMEMILQRKELGDFSAFEPLFEKVRQLQGA